MGVNPIPEGYAPVTPYLIVEGRGRRARLRQEAFGAEEKFRMDGPNGKIGHAEVKIGDSIVMMGRCRRGEPGHAGDDPSLRRRLRRDI